MIVTSPEAFTEDVPNKEDSEQSNETSDRHDKETLLDSERELI